MTRRRRMAGRLVLALSMMAILSGCESGARQDPLLIRGSTDDIVFANVPLSRDRTVDESIVASLELADYAVALDRAGLLDTLRRAGPFTVFAVPNEPLEAAQRDAGGALLRPDNHANLRRLMAYTIVPGRYTAATLRRMIAARRGPVGLTTLDGHDMLSVSVEPATGQLLLADALGRSDRVWLADVPQSNGVLYATQSLLSPDRMAIAAAPSAGTYVPGDYSTGVGARR